MWLQQVVTTMTDWIQQAVRWTVRAIENWVRKMKSLWHTQDTGDRVLAILLGLVGLVLAVYIAQILAILLPILLLVAFLNAALKAWGRSP